MATALEQASSAWTDARKLRKHLVKQIEKLRTNVSGTDIAQFDAVDDALGQFRLACVTTIFLDMEYAKSEGTEDVLWQQHVAINTEFRRILGRLRQDSRVVEKRKVEAKYGHFLRIAQRFYQVYIQRLSDRYDIGELKRIARSIETEEHHANDMISPVPPDLASKVLISCHSTLIHLGDLARYRVQAKHKKSYETALSFYSLAYDVLPYSGFALHQMGIVSLDEGNHLDIVYYFYRSWAVREPHPMAQQNLESEFKNVQNHNTTSRGKASSPTANDAFVMWFVRLHALFYKGEPVSAHQNELEREVFHRLSMAVKDASNARIVSKMALVNISACCIASMRYTEAKSESSSRFFQYALLFNAKFIVKICEAIEADTKAPPGDQLQTSAGHDQSASKPSVRATLLPVLRVYCIWITAYRSEIYASPLFPRDVIPLITRAMASVLTLFCGEISSTSQHLESCPYLLPEDIEIRGHLAFNDDRVPAAYRGYCSENGRVKPYPESQRLESSKESVSRILDILRSGYYLAQDPIVPLTQGTGDCGLIFSYEADVKPAEAPSVSLPSATPEQRIQPSLQNARAELGREPAGSQMGSYQARPLASSPAMEPSGVLSEQRLDVPTDLPPAMNDADKTVVNMLSPFLDDAPSPKPDRNSRVPEEPSYGMHSSTANEIAQELLKSFQTERDEPAPYYESFNSPNFGSSTWNNIFTSTSRLPGSPPVGQSASFFPGQRGSNRSSYGSTPMEEMQANNFAIPSRPATRGLQPNMAGHSVSPGPMSAEGLQHKPLMQHLAAEATSPRHPAHSKWQTANFPTPIGQLPGKQGQQHVHDGTPMSPSSSGFSHPSSLYQGTPPVGYGYGRQTAHGTYGTYGGAAANNGAIQDGNLSSRQFQMGQSASSYDAAIFEAALRGKK